MRINISISGQNHLKIPFIEFDNTASLNDLRKKIADHLEIPETELKLQSCFHHKFTAPKAIRDTYLKDSIQDIFGLSNTESISIVIGSKNMITSKFDVIDGQHEKLKIFHYEYQRMEAQKGLRLALEEALKKSAHIIITVGSHLPTKHLDYEDSLRRQQFPLERLGKISDKEPVYLIHIDPGFANYSEKTPPQWHEQKGWECKQKGLVSIYTQDNFTITTIAQPLTNENEKRAYFSDEKTEEFSVLDVNLEDFIKHAEKLGTGFITGNFYNPTVPVEVIKLPATPAKDFGTKFI